MIAYDCLWRGDKGSWHRNISSAQDRWPDPWHSIYCFVQSWEVFTVEENKEINTNTHTHTHTHKHTLNAPIEEIENRTVTMKRDKEADNADQEERRIQRRLEEKRRILEMQRWRRKKRRKKRKEGKSLLNDCKFSKTKLSKLVLTTFDGIHFDWFRFWNQFEIQIDKCDLPQVSNFLTLKSW